MNRLFSILLLLFALVGTMLAGDVQIDKANCTITKDGKTFPLYGKVVYVTDNPDITIQIVDEYADIYVELTNSPYLSCGEWHLCTESESYPDIRVKIVEEYADLTVKFVKEYPHIQ